MLLVSQVANHVPRVAGACFLPTHRITYLAAHACCYSTALVLHFKVFPNDRHLMLPASHMH